MKRLALILCLLGEPGLANTTTGSDVLELCNSQEIGDVTFCFGYIVGTWEGTRSGAMAMLAASGYQFDNDDADTVINDALGICIPDGVDYGQIVDVFRKYLSDNPSTRHKSARFLLLNSLIDAYPCE